MKWVCPLVLCGVVLGGSRLSAQQVGDDVVVVAPSPLKIKNDIVGQVAAGTYVRVFDVCGDWLWVSRGVVGWIRKSAVRTPREAIGHFTRQIDERPRDAGGYLGRAAGRYCDEQYDAAIDDLGQAIALDPDHSTAALMLRGEVWHAKEEPARAQADFDAAVQQSPHSAEVWFARGYHYVLRHMDEPALADIDEAIRLAPGMASAYVVRAHALINSERYDQALVELATAIRLNPRRPDAYAERSRALAQQGEIDRALADVTRAIRLQSKLRREHANWYEARAWLWGKKSEYLKAIADLDEGLRLDPKSASVLMARGAARYNCGQSERAIADLDKALAMRPTDGDGLIARAAARAKMGDDDGAIADATEAIRLRPDFENAYRVRIAIFVEREQYDRAIADATELVELSPESSAAFANRAKVHASSSNYQDALADLSTALAIDPANANLWDARAHVQTRLDDLDAALADADRSVELEPRNAAWWISRSAIWLARHEADRALADASEAVRLDPSERAYTNRGMAHVWKGELDAAEADFLKALECSPADLTVRMNLAMVHEKRGQVPAAIDQMTLFIRQHPGNAWAHCNRGTFYVKAGQYSEAVADFTAAIESFPKTPHDIARQFGWTFQTIACSERPQLNFPGSSALLAQIYGERAGAWWRMQNPTSALADLNESLRLAPDQPKILVARAALRLWRREFIKAELDAARAQELDETYFDAGMYRAMALLMQRDLEAAAEVAARACERAADATDERIGHLRETVAAARAEEFQTAAQKIVHILKYDPACVRQFRLQLAGLPMESDWSTPLDKEIEGLNSAFLSKPPESACPTASPAGSKPTDVDASPALSTSPGEVFR